MKRREACLAISFLLVILAAESQPVTEYIRALKAESRAVQATEDPLYREIAEMAEEYDVPPVEPRIDPVWKLIPGYNGVRLDVETTYRLANRKKGTYVPVLEEIPVQKTVWDLPPAPIYRGNPNKRMVALMINVAWGNEYLSAILATLAKKNVKATFFFDGTWVSKNPDLARQIHQAGHEIGNHGMTHPLMSRLSKERILEEMDRTNAQIRTLLGITPTLFAPPAGDYDERVVQLARSRKMLTILWTLDTVDWRKPETEEMVRRIVRQAGNGHLILMHPTKPTAEGLEAIIDGIRKKGLELSTVSQVLSPSRQRNIEVIGEF